VSKSSDSIEESAQEPLRFEPEPAENAQPWVEKLDDGYPKPEPLIGAEEEAPVERTAGGVGRRLVLGLLALSLIFGAAGGAGATFLVLGGLSGESELGTQIRQTLISEQSATVNVAERISPAIVTIEVTSASGNSVGSGVIYSADGWIVTNRHVVDGESSMTVHLKDGRDFPGSVYGIDTLTDLAIVKIDATGLTAATLGRSGAIQVGQTAIAIGSPLGVYTNSVTAGIISAIGREITTESGRLDGLLQTDAAINPGNSGGPLFNMKGEIIGINTAIIPSGQGIGFAIPVNTAKPLIPQLVAKGRVTRGYLGVNIQGISPELAAAMKLSDSKGALVADVVPGGPADKAGIRRGDVIVGFDGKSVGGNHELPVMVAATPVDREVKVTVIRDGKEQQLLASKVGQRELLARAGQRV